MQSILTASIEIIAIGFALMMLVDFAIGLRQLWLTSAQQKSESDNEIEPKNSTPIAPQPQLQKPATLQWLEQNAITETVPVEFPNVIELAHVRQAKTQVQEVTYQPESVLDLAALKLYKLHGYSVTRVTDLPIEFPSTIKRYKLHKREVVRLVDIESYLTSL